MRNAGGPPEDDVKAVMAWALTSNGIHHFLEQLEGSLVILAALAHRSPATILGLEVLKCRL